MGDQGNGNEYTILIMRDCLKPFVEGKTTADEQVEAIRARVEEWATILFQDGELENAFYESKLDSKPDVVPGSGGINP